jgi:phosphate transport system substrate-binding protein
MNKVLLAAVLGSLSLSLSARENIQIAGSSTVLPFASVVAEEFGQSFSQFKTPVVGSGGSSGGIRQFCQGTGPNTIDIANSSRKIKDKELAACAEKGVKKVIEIKIGYDGIVFASRRDSNKFELTTDHIAAAAKGTAKTWNEIDPKLPNQEIMLIIPASNHGTREVFEHKALGCKKECTLRQDGRIIEIAGDYTETLAKLNVDKNAIGVFGLSFYDSNRDKLQVASVNGVIPTVETIESGKYPISRPLYFYIKGEHIGVIPGLKEYAKFFISEGVSGTGSSLEKAGLVPLNNKERAEQASKL